MGDDYGIHNGIMLRCRKFIEAAQDIAQLRILSAVTYGAAHDHGMAETHYFDIRIGNRRAQHLRQIINLLFGNGYFICEPRARAPYEHRRMPRRLAVDHDLRTADRHDAGDAPIAYGQPLEARSPKNNGMP